MLPVHIYLCKTSRANLLQGRTRSLSLSLSHTHTHTHTLSLSHIHMHARTHTHTHRERERLQPPFTFVNLVCYFTKETKVCAGWGGGGGGVWNSWSPLSQVRPCIDCRSRTVIPPGMLWTIPTPPLWGQGSYPFFIVQVGGFPRFSPPPLFVSIKEIGRGDGGGWGGVALYREVPQL